MKNIREIVAQNLVALRKNKQLTQVKLAEKINYSDKAISRWENGEVLPDLETLDVISQEYGVPLSYFLEEHTNVNTKKMGKPSHNEMLLHAVTLCVIWVVLTILFVYLNIFYKQIFWQVFLWGVPISTFFSLRFMKKWADNKWKAIFRSIFNWSLLASIYCQFISYNLFLIFLIGIPIQAGIIVAAFAKPKDNIYS